MTTRHQAAFYNPHLLTPAELSAGFIARQPLLELLLDDLRRGGGQHHLLVGVRGTGKTTLLLRLGLAIDEDERLAKKVIALRFPEEQYNVGRLSDFWLNCVSALIDALEDRGETAEATRLEAECDKLDGVAEDARVAGSLGLLQAWAAKSRKLVVLLVDNLDLVLDRLSEHHWALRKVLGADQRLMIIGASSSFLSETFEYGSAFYEFFNTHELGPLDEAEARRVLIRLAEIAGTPEVAEVIANDEGRFRAILQLSGGTPRTLALLHGILARGQSNSAEQDLEAMLDLVTPYYKSRIEDLPAQAQLVVDAVALHWHPISAAECSARSGLEINPASAQLARLVRTGTIEKVAGGGSKLAFQLAERLFNIWYLMRANRRLRRKLFWVAASIQAIYGQEEVERRAAALLATPAGKEAAGDPARLLAFASIAQDEAVRRRLEHRAIAQLASRGFAIESEMDLRGEDRHLQPVVDRVRALDEARRIATAIQWPRGTDPADCVESLLGSWWFTLHEKLERARAWAKVPPTRSVVENLLKEIHPWWRAVTLSIGRGEVPSPQEVVSCDEIDDLVAVGSSQSSVFVLMGLVLALSSRKEPSASLWDYLLTRDDVLPGCLIEVAGSRVFDRGGWSEARTHLSRALPLLVPSSFVDLQLWRGLVQRGQARRLHELLVEMGCHERALPLYEALRAIANEQSAPLIHLAPELRAPTEHLLAGLLAPGDVDEVPEQPSAVQRPKTKAYAIRPSASARAAEPPPAKRNPARPKPAVANKPARKPRATGRRGSG